jgi:large conductance mechanosensitive channel
MKLSELWKQFKGFALKGNVTDLAVAVVLGTAFGAVVNSLVKDVIMPILSYIVPHEGGYTNWKVGRVLIGKFLSELLNFAVVSAALFVVMVQVMGAVQRVMRPYTGNEPTTKECPFCFSVIPARATKCSHCTADLPAKPISDTA